MLFLYVYTCHDVQHQNVSIALALSDVIFGKKGVCRVHGGGFAGTIQAFVPNYLVSNYQKEMDPHTEYHHIKKENIGLIEVMGLAVLPARLKKEIGIVFAKVLEDAGVYKRTDEGKVAFKRFIESL